MPKRTATILISLFLLQCLVTGAPLKVEKGVLDLRHIRQGDAFTVKMNGEWEFFFNKFLYTTPDFSMIPCHHTATVKYLVTGPLMWLTGRDFRDSASELTGQLFFSLRDTVTAWDSTCLRSTRRMR